MIITKQKPFEEIVRFLKGYKSIFIVGCGSCATLCKTGGEEEAMEMKTRLEKEGLKVTGFVIPDETCQIPLTERKLRENKKKIKQSDAILVMACGSGTQSISLSVDKPVYPGIDSLFIGNVVKFGSFEERCSACGNCYLGETTGICPITCCPKGILNGPCGGVEDGKCDVDATMDCIWVQIYDRLEKKGQLDRIKKIEPPRKHDRKKNPNRLSIDK
jgi:ferredoxin